MERLRGWVFVLIVLSFVTAYGLGADSKESTNERFDLYVIHPSVASKTFSVKPRLPGKPIEAVVTVHNRLKSSFSFKRFEASCTCATAKVPETILEPGDKVECAFSFKPTKAPRAVDEHYSVAIECDGAVQRSVIGFSVKWVGFVAFERPQDTITFSEASSKIDFKLPLIGTDDETIRQSTLHHSPELSFLDAKISGSEGRRFLIGSFYATSIPGKQVVGEVVLKSKAGVESNLLLTLRKEQRASILPSKVMFVPSTGEAGERTGRVLLKLLSSDPVIESTIRSLVCKTPAGKLVDVQYERLTPETFRLDITIKKGVELSDTDELSWTIVAGDGETILLTTSMYNVYRGER